MCFTRNSGFYRFLFSEVPQTVSSVGGFGLPNNCRFFLDLRGIRSQFSFFYFPGGVGAPPDSAWQASCDDWRSYDDCSTFLLFVLFESSGLMIAPPSPTDFIHKGFFPPKARARLSAPPGLLNTSVGYRRPPHGETAQCYLLFGRVSEEIWVRS